jgi:uncharacterized membrane protein YebE (DUF533 family)
MKTLALVLLALGGLSAIPLGFMAVFTTLMSFDAPDSFTNLREWWARLVIVAITLGMGALLYFGYQAYQQNNYSQASLLLGIYWLVIIGFLLYSYSQ